LLLVRSLGLKVRIDRGLEKKLVHLAFSPIKEKK
jgi:hypothetical protein